MKYRIRKIPHLTVLHYLEKEHWLWGWTKIFAGTDTQCKKVLSQLKSRGTDNPDVIIQESF